MSDGSKLFYDIDADGRVYWLQPTFKGKLMRRRVVDTTLAETIRNAANNQDWQRSK